MLLLFVFLLAIVYALPNLYGDDPALQISSSRVNTTQADLARITAYLQQHQFHPKGANLGQQGILIRFHSTDEQLRAQGLLQQLLGEKFTIASNLAPATPGWLRAIGAHPMKLGLDLRGGVHFLLDVDVNSVISKRQGDAQRDIATRLREARLRYRSINRNRDESLTITFQEADVLAKASTLLAKQFPDLTLKAASTLNVSLSPQAVQQIQETTLQQTITILRNRINELGVSEPVVQRQGLNRISVDLPGIQDTARAKRILGGTATIEMRLVDDQHDPRSVIGGVAPIGTKLYTFENGQPVLLQNQVVLSGNAISSATAGFDQQTGTPSVDLTVSGSQVSYFSHVTARNIGKAMGIVFIEKKPETKVINGKSVTTYKTVSRVISAPRIMSALGTNFSINNMESTQSAQNLALLLRAGALIAPISIVESRIVGPSLGADNIAKGVTSLLVGLSLVVLFMLAYYRTFGIFANLGLMINLVLLIALLSIFGAVLTLPGIAGIVLTLGMAVDANVLINERIREELRQGMAIQSAIYAGYAKAFATIVDANLTTLIVGLVLFAIGTGAVKGFAITTTLGLMTSMLSGVTYTRALVNLYYGNRQVDKLSIGI